MRDETYSQQLSRYQIRFERLARIAGFFRLTDIANSFSRAADAFFVQYLDQQVYEAREKAAAEAAEAEEARIDRELEEAADEAKEFLAAFGGKASAEVSPSDCAGCEVDCVSAGCETETLDEVQVDDTTFQQIQELVERLEDEYDAQEIPEECIGCDQIVECFPGARPQTGWVAVEAAEASPEIAVKYDDAPSDWLKEAVVVKPKKKGKKKPAKKAPARKKARK